MARSPVLLILLLGRAIDVDAYPQRTFHGTVLQLGAAYTLRVCYYSC